MQFQIKFGGVGTAEPADVAGEFNHRHLETQAQAQVGHLVFTGVANALDLAFGAADAKAAGHDDAVTSFKLFGDVGGIDVSGFDEPEFDVHSMMHRAMFGGLDDRCIGIAQAGVLAGQGDVHLSFLLADPVGIPLPAGASVVFPGLVHAIVQ